MLTTRNSTTMVRKLIFFAGVGLILQGCQGGQMNDLKEFVETAYQDEKPKIDPLPEIQPFQGFEYVSADDDADPFSFDNIVSNRDEESVGAGTRPDTTRIKEALEDYPLDALRMVGTLTQAGTPWVIVKTTQGTAHLASLGNYMGQNDGKITQIVPDEQRVVLEETVADPAGRWVTRDVEITIDEQ